MPVVTLPDGRSIKFADTMSQEQIENVIQTVLDSEGNGQPAQQPQAEQQPTEQGGVLDQVVGGLEAGASLVSGAVAEPIAGIAGLAKSITSGPEAATESIEGIKEALTFEPRTESGQQKLNAIGEVIGPVGEAFQKAEKFLGDKAFELTGSPAIAAAAATIPTALTEAVGFKIGKAKGLKKAGVGKKGIAKALDEAVETPEQLKTIASNIYNEIDELGVTVKPDAFNRLIEKIEVQSVKRGLDKTNTPAAQRFIDRLKEEAASGDPITLSKLDTLRKGAQVPASSLIPTEKALGSGMINSIDDFLDTAQSTGLNIPEGVTTNISKRYEVARNLWGRVKKSEVISDLLHDADLQATGFDAGLRIAARKLLKNKKKIKFFNAEEVQLIKNIEGGKPGIAGLASNFISGTGRLGIDFSKGGGGFLGPAASFGTAGAALGGANPGVLAVPVIGLVSRKLGEKLVKGRAVFADKVIRAGRDGNKIVKAYVRNVPPKLRSADELAELLRNPRIELANLPDNPLVRDAVASAVKQRALLTAAGSGAAIPDERSSVDIVDVVPGPITERGEQ